MHFLRRKYLQKPRQWGPISVVRSAALDWFNRHGIPAPIGYWPMIEGAGPVLYNIINAAKSDSFPNGVSWSTAAGGHSILLDGSSGQIELDSNAVPTMSSPWELIGLVQHATGSTIADEPFFGFLDSAGKEGAVLAIDDSASESYKIFSIGETPGDATATLDANEHTLSLSFDGTKLYFWIDGVDDYDVTPTGSDWQTADSLWIGCYTNGGKYINAYFKSLLCFSQRLAHDQRNLLYNQPYAPIQPRSIPFFSIPATAGSTSVVPVIMQQLNQFNGGLCL